MSDKKIKSVSCDFDKHILEVGYSFPEDDGNKVTVEKEVHKARFHDDLITAFGNLKIHLALMTGYFNPTQIKNIDTPKPELSEDFRVTQYSLGKKEDDPGVTITGGRTISHMNGKFIALNAPYTRFEEGEETAYKFVKDLKKRIDRCEAEVLAYLSGEKRGVDPQQKLDFPPPMSEAGHTPHNPNELNMRDKEVEAA